jgi:ankyrin repeat protein
MAVAKLLELGADPNLRTEAGSTAMHLAAAYGHYTTVGVGWRGENEGETGRNREEEGKGR